MSKFIKDAIHAIGQAFPDDWEVKYGLNTSPPEGYSALSKEYLNWYLEYEQSSKPFNPWLEELKIIIFDKLNASVLSGEYVEIDDFEGSLKELLSCLNRIPIPGTPHFIIQRLLNDKFKTNFVDQIKLGVQLYLDLFNQVRLRQQVDGIDYVPIPNFEKGNNKYKDSFFDDQHTDDSVRFFSFNLQTAKTDHFLTPDLESLRDLQEIEYYSSQLEANKFAFLLKNKSTFLISKWILRKEELTKEPVNVISGGTTKELNIESLKCKLLPKWKDYIESHYEIDTRTFKNKIKSRFDSIKGIDIVSRELIDLHCQIKYFKDVSPDYKNLRAIREELGRRWKISQGNDTKNDKYALSISFLYAINNEFSFVLKHYENNEEKIANLYQEIVSLQKATGLKNFFPQHKYLEYLVNRLKSIYDKRKALDGVKSSREIIQKCERVFAEYQANILWSERNYNYVFLLPFKDCFIPVENEILEKVYIASSFILPLSKTKYIHDFEEIRRDFYTYKSSIEVFENLEKDIRDIQNRELRSMEIIGIFTAIVTFIASSIPAFKFIDTAYQAAIFMFALACSMAVFVLMVIISSRGIQKLKQHSGIIFLLSLLGIFAWFCLIYFTTDPVKKGSELQIKNIELRINKIDSTLLNKPKIPSYFIGNSNPPR